MTSVPEFVLSEAARLFHVSKGWSKPILWDVTNIPVQDPILPNAVVIYEDDKLLGSACSHRQVSLFKQLFANNVSNLSGISRGYAVFEPELKDINEVSRVSSWHFGLLNPNSPGELVRRLKQAGIFVEVGLCHFSLESEYLSTCYGFVKKAKRPWVILKAATSLDGKIATSSGESQWITCDEARALGRSLRAQVDAIIVGRKTVQADNPKLTARQPGYRDPLRVVADSRLQISLTSHLVTEAHQTPTIVFTTVDTENSSALLSAGVCVRRVDAEAAGRVNLHQLLETLKEIGCATLLIEGGGELAGAFVDRALVDEVYWFVAPKIIGGLKSRVAVAGEGIQRLSDVLRLKNMTSKPVGTDWLFHGLVEHQSLG